MQDRLKHVALHGTAAELAEKQTDFGFRYNPHSWLHDEELNVQAMEVIAWDIMHCWCQGGAWEVELGAFLECMSKHGYGSRKLHVGMLYSIGLSGPGLLLCLASCLEIQ